MKFLQLHFRPIEVEIQRSIVFLDNFHLIDESLDLDLSDLAMRLQLEFNAKKMKVQAKNLLFVYVVLPNKYPPYELFRVCDSPDYYPNHIGVSSYYNRLVDISFIEKK